MALRQLRHRTKGEPTIALINVVFLMLIFFMIAGALAPPLDGQVALVETAELEGRSPPDAAVIRQDGTLRYRDRAITASEVVAEIGPELRLVPDRALPAEALMRIAAELAAAGAIEIWLVTETGVR